MRKKVGEKYILTGITEEEKIEIKDLISIYSEKKNEISSKKKEIFSDENLSDSEKKEKFSEYKKNLSEELKNISEKIKNISEKISGLTKNILLRTSFEDEMIGSGKDSLVYDRGDGYVYKESVSSREINEKSLEYVQKKYEILRLYLGDIIPKSYSVFGESVVDLGEGKRDLDGVKGISDKLITIQKKVEGKNLQEISFEEKITNKELKEELEKVHGRYTLLRMYLNKIRKKIGVREGGVDLKMDLGDLSEIDTLYLNNPKFVSEKVKSPNVMWDEKKKKIKLIDFDEGFWTEDMEKVYLEMKKPEVIDKWNLILESFE